jgi:recombination protein RecA
MSEVIKKGEKTFGPGTFTKGSDGVPDFPRLPTGVFTVDYATAGGIPIHVTSSFFGPAGGGKSTLMYKSIAAAQEICWRCYEYHWDCECADGPLKQKAILLPLEKADTSYMADLGIDLEELIIVEPDSGEQGVDIIVECLKAEDVGVVALDSLVSLVPEDEIESSASQSTVALQARLIAGMMRKIKSTLVRQMKLKHNVLFLTTNQIRAKIGGMPYQNPEDMPGGNVSKHDWHLTLRISQLSSDRKDKATNLPIESKFRASNVAMANKRKCYMLSGDADYYIVTSHAGEYYRGTVNDKSVVFKYAEAADLIDKSNWSFTLMPDRTHEKKTDLLDSWDDVQVLKTVKKRLVSYYVQQSKNT